MLVKTFAAAVNGLDVTTVTVEVSLLNGEGFRLSGLGDEAVRQAQSRILTAIVSNQLRYPERSITVNLAPADLRKEGSSFDLPIAIGLLAADRQVDEHRLPEMMIVGELGLDGRLQPVRGALTIAMKAREQHFAALIVPRQNAREAAVVNRLAVYGMESLRDVVDFLNGRTQPEAVVVDTRGEFARAQAASGLDFADVRGQETVKRACEVAAAGGHNLIMIGPPGSGKSMIAKRLPSILPPLTLRESLETTQIHSIAGKLPRGSALMATRPFRAPHHTISQVALVGGGNTPQPGEISLAHNGVLFADELPEFSKKTLEVLRQPLEDRHVTVARARYSTDYPCSSMFVASMNPCPCGYYGDPQHRCDCTPGQRRRYLSRISGPLLDRIDIHCDIMPVPFAELSKSAPAETSAEIRARVIAARERQTQRFAETPGVHCNAQMSESMLRRWAQPSPQCLALLEAAMRSLSLSARAYNRILKVARTIADLEGEAELLPHHVSEAISYRTLDRADWADRGL